MLLSKMEDVAGKVAGAFILQVVSVLDVTKPSSKQLSGDGGQGRVLMLRVTDGSKKYSAIELARIPKLSLDTPPGTKILLKNVRYVKHKLLLEPSTVLGVDGEVKILANNFQSSRLLERQYKLGKDMQAKPRNGANQGPPAFDAFKPRTSGSRPDSEDRAPGARVSLVGNGIKSAFPPETASTSAGGKEGASHAPRGADQDRVPSQKHERENLSKGRGQSRDLGRGGGRKGGGSDREGRQGGERGRKGERGGRRGGRSGRGASGGPPTAPTGPSIHSLASHFQVTGI